MVPSKAPEDYHDPAINDAALESIDEHYDIVTSAQTWGLGAIPASATEVCPTQ